MGVLNVTPDSFSDGGEHNTPDRAVERAATMVKEGAQIIDIGGESTRPGADLVEIEQELDRTIPIIGALCESGVRAAVSIDTRKAAVAKAALAAGAQMFNDVSAFSFDPDSLPLAVAEQPFVCLMHAQGAPKTMQDNPEYRDVTLDVYDYLKERVQTCVDAGLARDRIVIDPGIGFGKTTEHNLQLLRDLSIFHGLGCPILLGVSRKRFIGVIGSAQEPAQRAPGSIAVALEGLRQGVQITRVHDVWQTKQAFALWQAMQ
jgi:dihydropteroate synthase